MRKVVAAINMTLDGIGDHTSVSPDEEIHQHYAGLLENADVILYGRITYHLMQYWQTLAISPSGEKSMDNFAIVMDRIPKIVFSNTLQSTGWESAQLANQPLEEVIENLKQLPGRDILVGSRSLIIQLLELNRIDEFQLCIHPVIAGNGQALFENLKTRIEFRLTRTKKFQGGAVTLYYERVLK